MKYINDEQKDQITRLIAKIGINIFSKVFNAEIGESDCKSYYEIVELIKNIIVKINIKDIPVVYCNIINNMISEFRKNSDKSDCFDIPTDIWSVIYDILDISQIDVRDCKDVNISISAPPQINQDKERLSEEIKEKLSTVLHEYCADFEKPVKPKKNRAEVQNGTGSISEERFTKIVDRLYGMVHNPFSPACNFETPLMKMTRTFPDVKISEYAAMFDL